MSSRFPLLTLLERGVPLALHEKGDVAAAVATDVDDDDSLEPDHDGGRCVEDGKRLLALQVLTYLQAWRSRKSTVWEKSRIYLRGMNDEGDGIKSRVNSSTGSDTKSIKKKLSFKFY